MSTDQDMVPLELVRDCSTCSNAIFPVEVDGSVVWLHVKRYPSKYCKRSSTRQVAEPC